jgi:hypothetical protein
MVTIRAGLRSEGHYGGAVQQQPLVREGASQQETRNCPKVIAEKKEIDRGSQMGT